MSVIDFVPKKAAGKILAVCAGRVIGQPKRSVGQGQLLKNFGLSGDCDTGPGSTQLVLLSQTGPISPQGPKAAGGYGSQGENLAITLDLSPFPPGTRLRSQDALIELTGRDPPLYTARVILPGIVTEGDPIVVE